jgi:hypothetical protein
VESEKVWRRVRRAAVVSLVIGAVASTTPAPASGLFGDTRAVGANAVSTATLEPPTGLVATPSCTGSPAITFRGPGSGRSTAVGYLAVGRPSGTTEGDFTVAAISWEDSTFISAGSDWTLIRTDYERTRRLRRSVFYKFAGPSEPLNHPFTSGGTAPHEPAGVIGVYAGVDPASPIEAHGGQVQTTPADDPITAPSVTSAVPGAWLVGFFGSTEEGDITPPPGMTERRDVQVTYGDGTSLSLNDEVLSSAGPTGARVAQQVGVPNMGIGQVVALRPATSSSDPAVTLDWTPTVSSFATGYTLSRWNGAVMEDQWSPTPSSTATYTDEPLVSGTTHDFRLESV